MIAVLHLPYAAPNLNDLLRGRGGEAGFFASIARARKTGRPMRKAKPPVDGYNAAKAQWHTRVAAHVREQHIPTDKFEHGAHVDFQICEVSRRRDPDNFCSGASKLVLDALVKARVLPNDGWDGVLSISYSWAVAERPSVRVTLSSERLQRSM
jgi:Holliday junction resolvase RusA-like endonuclease